MGRGGVDYRGAEGTSGGDGTVLYLDYVTGLCAFVKTHRTGHRKE